MVKQGVLVFAYDIKKEGFYEAKRIETMQLRVHYGDRVQEKETPR